MNAIFRTVLWNAILAQMRPYIGFCLSRLTSVVDKLVIYPDNMLANMNKFRGLVMSQRVLLALTQAGVSREDAYRLVQRNAMKVWEEGKDFKTELLGDADVTAALSVEEIEEKFDLGYHTKHVERFSRVFSRIIQFGKAFLNCYDLSLGA